MLECLENIQSQQSQCLQNDIRYGYNLEKTFKNGFCDGFEIFS